jgi:hypothetical protein
LKDPVSPQPPRYVQHLAQRYDERVSEYDVKLYPHAQSIMNVHRLACMVYPEAKTVNPLELWDLHFLRQLHASG